MQATVVRAQAETRRTRATPQLPALQFERGAPSISHANHQTVDIGGLKLLANAVELVELADGADAYAMPHIVIDSYPLHLRVDALQVELCPHALRIRNIPIRAGLQNIDARSFDAG